MRKKLCITIIRIVLIVCFCIIIPNISVFAAENNNFKVTVETEKEEYKKGEEIEYKINIKNINDKTIDNIIINKTLSENAIITESNGKIIDNKIEWKIQKLDSDEEYILKVKVKLEEDNIVSNPTEDSNINIEVIPNTGSINSIIIILIAIIIVISGLLLFKNKNSNAKKSIILVFILTTSLFSMTSKFVNAEDSKIREEFKHNIKIGNEFIESTISIEGILYIESDNNALTWDIKGHNTYLKNALVELNVTTDDDTITDKLKDIEWRVIGTEIKGESNSVKFNAPNKVGEYVIEAVLKINNKKLILTKKIIVSDIKDLLIDEDVPFNGDLDGVSPDSDDDLDGISNAEEEMLGLDPSSRDSDLDGVNDYDEIYVHNTEPLNSDTDKDGVLDGYEVFLGYNPLDISDVQEEYSYCKEDSQNNLSVLTKGSAEAVVNVQINTVEDEYLSSTLGTVGNIVDLKTKGDFSEAVITFIYDYDKIIEKNLDEESLKIYYIDENNLELVELDSQVDLINKTISATTPHFSKYVVGDSSKINTELGSVDIVFVLDNSGSMDENDAENKRISVTRELISELNGDYRFGLVKFAGTDSVLSNLTENKENLYSALDSIKKSEWTGTNLTFAIKGGLSVFEDNNNRKIMILLADGDDNRTSIAQINAATEKALDEGVTIYTVGLGNNLDHSILRNIANKTYGKYFHSQDADELKKIFENIETSVTPPENNNETIIYGNVERNVKLIASNGFDINTHAFNFNNFTTKESSGGTCYGLAATSYLMYKKSFPKIGKRIFGISNGINFSYDLSNKGIIQANKFNVDELFHDKNIEYNEKNNFYYDVKDEDGNIIARALNFYGVMYYEKCGIKTGVITVDGLEYEVPAFIFTSVNDLKSYGDFTEDDIEIIKTLVWWYKSQSVNTNKELFTNQGIDGIKEFVNLCSVIGFRWMSEDEEGKEKEVGHAVVAMKLYEDLDEIDTYYMEIYDNSIRFNGRQYLKINNINSYSSSNSIVGNSDSWGFSNVSNIYSRDIIKVLDYFNDKGYIKY